MEWKDPSPRTLRSAQDAFEKARESFSQQAGQFVFYDQGSEFIMNAPGDVIVGEVVER